MRSGSRNQKKRDRPPCLSNYYLNIVPLARKTSRKRKKYRYFLRGERIGLIRLSSPAEKLLHDNQNDRQKGVVIFFRNIPAYLVRPAFAM